jgi:hypothetical protein
MNKIAISLSLLQRFYLVVFSFRLFILLSSLHMLLLPIPFPASPVLRNTLNQVQLFFFYIFKFFLINFLLLWYLLLLISGRKCLNWPNEGKPLTKRRKRTLQRERREEEGREGGGRRERRGRGRKGGRNRSIHMIFSSLCRVSSLRSACVQA